MKEASDEVKHQREENTQAGNKFSPHFSELDFLLEGKRQFLSLTN